MISMIEPFFAVWSMIFLEAETVSKKSLRNVFLMAQTSN